VSRVENDKRIQPRTKGLGEQQIVVEPEPRTAAAVFKNLSGRAIREIRHEHGTSDGRSGGEHPEREACPVERDHGKPAIDAGLAFEDRVGAALHISDAQLDAARSRGEIGERIRRARLMVIGNSRGRSRAHAIPSHELSSTVQSCELPPNIENQEPRTANREPRTSQTATFSAAS
jgi:hypothetical protein